jgi:hypothetical protein
MKSAAKVLLSFFILFQVSAMLVLANNSSFLARKTEKIFFGWGNLIGLNTTWNFFSPDPAHTMYFRILLRFKDPEKEFEEFYIPEETDRISLESSKRRFLYAVRYMLLSPDRIQKFLGPYFCRAYSDVDVVSVEPIFEMIPSLDRAVLGETARTKSSYEQIGMNRQSFACPALQQNENEDENEQMQEPVL